MAEEDPNGGDPTQSIDGTISDALLDPSGTAAQVEQAADMAQQGIEALPDILENVGDGLVEAGDAVMEVGADAIEIVSDGLETIGDGIEAAYNSKEAQAILAGGFGAIEDAYAMSADEAKELLNSAAGLAGAGWAGIHALLRLEIIRDFGQIVGSVFSSVYRGAEGAMKAVVDFFGSLFAFVTLNLTAFSESKEAAYAGIIIAIILAILAAAAYIWMISFSGVLKMATATSDQLRGGKEVKSFREQAKEMKENLYYVEKIITLCLSIYLPIATYVCQVIFCDMNSSIVEFSLISDNVQTCVDSKSLTYLSYVCWLLFLVFLLPLPIFLGICINETKPRGLIEDPDKIYNADGMMVDFDDKVYNDIVENDVTQKLNPFRSLYRGFENNFALYKIGMMVWKFMLIAPTIMLSGGVGSSTVWAAVFQTVVLIVQAVGFHYMAPFIDESTDIMDGSGRISAAAVAFGGMFTKVKGLNTFFGILLMIMNIVNMSIMGYYTMMGFGFCQAIIKNLSGRFTFSDTCRTINDMDAVTALKEWDIQKEVKHRVWQAFWNGILLKKIGKNNDNKDPESLVCGDEVPERLIKLQKDTVDNGLESIEHHWNGERDVAVSDARVDLRKNMEGVDMYWDGEEDTLDGHLDSETNFGKLIVQAYPFKIRIAYDDCDDVTIIKDNEKLFKFIEMNHSPKIEAKRAIRKNLRVMAQCKTPCHWPFSRWETHTVPDGTERRIVTDANGNTRTTEVQVYSDIEVEMFYTTGIIKVISNDPALKAAAGFACSMEYNDGHGSAIKPRTREMAHFHDLTADMPKSHFDCSNQFIMSAGLQRLFDIGRNDIERELAPLLNKEQEYRILTIESEKEQNAILSDGFWYFVYNDYKLSRDALLRYLKNQETNPILQNFAEDHAAGLDFLYKKLRIISLNPANETWYIFWEDFYHQNKNMNVIKDIQPLFDPKRALSLCYRPMAKKDLKELLERHGLYHEGDEDGFVQKYCSIFVKQHFTKQILDALYNKLDGKEIGSSTEQLDDLTNAGKAEAKAETVSPIASTP